MKLTDTRRLTGPSLLLNGPGAIAAVEAEDPAPLAEAWRQRLGALCEAVGWGPVRTAERIHPGGASLAFRAPLDALYAATEINETAIAQAVVDLGGDPSEALGDVGRAHTLAELRASIADERNPALVALAEAADAHGAPFLWDDDEATVGLGVHARTWPVAALPAPENVDWEAARAVPAALVTGTNGKSTTARMLAAILRAWGATPGLTSTDGVVIGGETVASGDYSGPGGARTALRDRRVTAAVLEVARGGILRRGLGLDRATAAAVTNVAEDHLGDYGITTVEGLARVKFVVAKALGAGGTLVTNWDDPHCRREGQRARRPLAARGARVLWTGLAPGVLPDGPAVSAVDGWIVRRDGHAGGDGSAPEASGEWVRVVEVAAVPAARGGAARYNVRNALTATGLARAMGVSDGAIADGLRAFVSDAETNPGRGNVFRVNGATAWVDFAHNAHSLAALTETVGALPAARRLVLLSHAGDRTDREIRAVGAGVAGMGAERYVVADLPDYLRGRAPGEVPGLLRGALLDAGAAPEAIAEAADPASGVRDALAWARPGDVLLLLVLSRRDDALAAIREAGGREA